MRLIDAEVLIKRAIGRYKEMMGTDIGHGMGVIASMITDAPTIDAVPVSQLREMLSNLERMCRGGDEGETYTTGYRNGHHNGQIELLRYILQVPDGTSEEERKGGEGNG